MGKRLHFREELALHVLGKRFTSTKDALERPDSRGSAEG
jgi:hypothetical protein